MLKALVQAVFDKALEEPTFVDMYADLCVRLNLQSTSWSFVKVGIMGCGRYAYDNACSFALVNLPSRLVMQDLCSTDPAQETCTRT